MLIEEVKFLVILLVDLWNLFIFNESIFMNLTSGSLVFNELIVTNLAKLRGDFTKMIRLFFLLSYFDNIVGEIYLCLIKESVITNLTEIKWKFW